MRVAHLTEHIGRVAAQDRASRSCLLLCLAIGLPVLQEILAEMGGKPDFIIGNYRLGAGRGDVEEAG